MKRNVFLTLTLILAAALLLAACNETRDPNKLYGSGVLASETRQLGSFSGVEMNLSGNVTIVQGDKEAIVIEAEDNILPFITTTIKNGRLVIDISAISFSTYKPMKFAITVNRLDTIVLNSSADIDLQALKGSSIYLRVNGSGDIVAGDVQADDRLTVEIYGSGDVTLGNGAAPNQTVEIFGSGNLDAGKVAGRQATIKVNGSGDTTLWVTDDLDVSILGSGDVSYYGTPAVKSEKLGSGKVIPLGNK